VAITLDSLTLPPDLIWRDEFDWNPVEAEQSYAVDGTQILQYGTKAKGRPITLSGDRGSGWITRADLLTLQALVQTMTTRTLTLHDGRTFQVVPRHRDKPLEAAPVVDVRNPDGTDYYTLILRLMEV
jgi:hypothetical protein